MNENIFLNQVKQIGIGLAFITFPMLFIFAFAVHPGYCNPGCFIRKRSYSEHMVMASWFIPWLNGNYVKH